MPPMAGAISFVYLTGSRNLLEALRPSRRLSGINTEHFAGKFWVLAQSMALCARRSHCRSLSRARNHFTDPGPKFGMLTNSSSVVSRRSPIVFSPANLPRFGFEWASAPSRLECRSAGQARDQTFCNRLIWLSAQPASLLPLCTGRLFLCQSGTSSSR